MSGTTSAETATLIAAGIGAVAALAGVVVERLLRFWGRLWCEKSEWVVRFSPQGSYLEGYEITKRLPQTDEERDAQHVAYSVRLDLFNGKEIPVGLRDVALVFKCSGGEVRSLPKDKATEYMGQTGANVPLFLQGPFYDRAHVINLPPRQWVIKELFDRLVEPEEVRLLSRWYRVEFVGERQRRGLFEPKTFRKTIASRPPYSDPFARAGSGSVPGRTVG